jgi:COPII coat assembly protein SEC16
MLAGAAANTKAKKAALLQWLDELTTETEREVGYVGNDSVVGRAKAEGKSVLIKLLKVLVENDGKLAGRYVICTTDYMLMLMIVLAQL